MKYPLTIFVLCLTFSTITLAHKQHGCYSEWKAGAMLNHVEAPKLLKKCIAEFRNLDKELHAVSDPYLGQAQFEHYESEKTKIRTELRKMGLLILDLRLQIVEKALAKSSLRDQKKLPLLAPKK